MIKIYTDGATSNNGKENARGGWAFAIVNNNNDKRRDTRMARQNSWYRI